MALPASYTEADLGDFIRASLGEVASTLGWTTLGHVQEAVNDAVIMCGKEAIADCTDVRGLRAAARVAGWRLAIASLTARFTFSTDQQTFNRGEMVKAAMSALRIAEDEAREAGLSLTSGLYAVQTGQVAWSDDPYAVVPDETRAI